MPHAPSLSLAPPPPSRPRVMQQRRAVPADAVRPTRAEVNLAHLRHNLRVMRRLAGGAGVWAVLKADGYGHGAKAVARTLERAGADGACVALLEEAIELREAGIKLPILVMDGYYGRAIQDLLAYDLTPVVHDVGQLRELAQEVRWAGAPPLGIHLKLDTGMARLGVAPSQLDAAAEALCSHAELQLAGLMTHLATADAVDERGAQAQLQRFSAAEAALARHGLRPTLRHAANTSALIRGLGQGLEFARPGIGLFGVEPWVGALSELRPVLSLRTEIVALRTLEPGESVGYGAAWTATRPSVIATVPIGYADGLPRQASSSQASSDRPSSGREGAQPVRGGALLVRGKRAPIAGVVSMDLTTLDVTDVEGVRIGDEAVVIGSQKGPLGEDSIGAAELAATCGTIPWDVLTAISRRVPRFYREP